MRVLVEMEIETLDYEGKEFIKEQVRNSNNYNNNLKAKNKYFNNYEFRWRESQKQL